MSVCKIILYRFAFQYLVTFLSKSNQLAFCDLFSVDLLLYMKVNKVNKCDNWQAFAEYIQSIRKHNFVT